MQQKPELCHAHQKHELQVRVGAFKPILSTKTSYNIAIISDPYAKNIGIFEFIDLYLRPDNGALFENFVMLELWRGKKTGGSLQFYRTADGTEVDFVMNQLDDRLAVECKYERLEKPTGNIALNNFCEKESIEKRYLANQNLNYVYKGVSFIQGFLICKIF